jgi:glutathione S-transferase
MSQLTLHYHPLSSYCQKVLIAMDELGVTADLRLLNLGDAAERAAFLALWPTGKMPLLIDQGQAVPESSIMIEHLQNRHAAAGRRLIPADPQQALDVRLWDRLFDVYVMTPMQALTGDLLRPSDKRDATGVAQARAGLATAYGLIERHMAGRTWAGAEDFSLADCAAAPALLYATAYLPIAAGQPNLSAYFERLMARASVKRTVEAARPFFPYFPGRAGWSSRWLEPQAS